MSMHPLLRAWRALLRPFRPHTAVAVSTIAVWLTIAPVQAQIYDRPMPPGAIIETLRDQGFDELSRPRRDGTVYRLEATSRRGERVSLVVDAYDGMILERGWRNRDDTLLPPRDVGRPGRDMLGALPEVRGYDPRNDYGARPLEAIPEEDPLSADLDDLPPVPGGIERMPLAPPPMDSLRSGEPSQPPLLGADPQQRDALRTQPPLRTNPLALPDAPPSSAPTTSEPRGPAGTTGTARGNAATPTRPAMPPSVGAVPAAPKPDLGSAKPATPPGGDQTTTATVAPRPRGKVRIIDGVTPVIPRDVPEAAKSN